MKEASPVSHLIGYSELLTDLKVQVRAAWVKAVRTVNTQLIELCWSIGNGNLIQQELQGWGSIAKRRAEDLRSEFRA